MMRSDLHSEPTASSICGKVPEPALSPLPLNPCTGESTAGSEEQTNNLDRRKEQINQQRKKEPNLA
jgi:hypothetical protein